jgi:hypothetical protein
MKILVCGSRGRHWKEDYDALDRELQQHVSFISPLTIIHGDCKDSPDELAKRWCEKNSSISNEQRFPAKWRDRNGTYNPQAGFERNSRMLEENPKKVVALWDGKSNGTLDTIRKACQKGIPVTIVPCGRRQEDS